MQHPYKDNSDATRRDRQRSRYRSGNADWTDFANDMVQLGTGVGASVLGSIAEALQSVGDSLRTDVLGGGKLGLHTCWYNPNGPEPGDAQPTYTVTRLEELYPIVMEAEELANVGSKIRKHQL